MEIKFFQIKIKLFNLLVLVFISIPFSSQAGFRSSFDSFEHGTNNIKSRESMTGRKSGWGLVNDNPNEVDLSEWGGVTPSCEIAPECPVCIK